MAATDALDLEEAQEGLVVVAQRHLGAGERELDAVFAALDRQPRIEYVDTPAEIRDKYQYFTQGEMTKLREAGFNEPSTELEDGVTDYVRSFLATDDPYR